MSNMIKIYAKELQDESLKILKDSSINDYTRWKYQRYLILANFILDLKEC